MKKYSYLALFFLLTTLTSCLKNGLEELPEFEGNSILAVRKVEYRFKGTSSSGVSGEPYLEYVELSKEATIDKEAKTVKIKVGVPKANSVFTEAEKAKCTPKNIAVMVSLETAARLSPVNGSVALGTPGDWSKPNKYIITAANGSQAEWTIEIVEFTHK